MSIISFLAQSSPYYSDEYYYSAPNIDNVDSAAVAGAFVFIMLFALIFTAIAYVVMALLLSRIFKKAGVEGWKAWVPVYNNWVMLELGGQKGYWALLALIPVVNIVAAVIMFIAMYQIGLNLGKEGVFVLLAIFLPIVWFAWLAFDKSTWKGARPIVAASPAAAPVVEAPDTQSEPVPPVDTTVDKK